MLGFEGKKTEGLERTWLSAGGTKALCFQTLGV